MCIVVKFHTGYWSSISSYFGVSRFKSWPRHQPSVLDIHSVKCYDIKAAESINKQAIRLREWRLKHSYLWPPPQTHTHTHTHTHIQNILFLYLCLEYHIPFHNIMFSGEDRYIMFILCGKYQKARMDESYILTPMYFYSQCL